MSRLCGWLILCGCLSTGVLAKAQDFGQSAWTNYTNANDITGLAASEQTLWLATTGGLVHLDAGEPADAVVLTNADGLGDNDLRFVTIDSQGRVWTGGVSGRLCRRFTDNVWRNYEFDPDNTSLVLNAAADGPDDFLWVGSSAGLHKFDIERHGGEVKENYESFGDPAITLRVEDVLIADGYVWIAGDNGVARGDVTDQLLNDPRRWRSWTGMPELNAIAQYAGHIYVGGSDGVWAYTDTLSNPGDTLWERIGFADRSVQDLHAAGDTLWVATDVGLGLCTADGCQPAPVLQTPQVYLTSLARTTDGAIWSGRQGTGVQRLRDGSSSAWTFAGPISNDIVDVAVGNDGKVWCAHRTAGADYLQDDHWRALDYYTKYVGSGGPGTGVAVAPNGDVWFCGWGGGATRVNPDNPHDDWTHYDTTGTSLMWVVDEVGVNNYIVLRDVAIDDAGRVWFANAFADSGRRLPFYDPEQGCWGSFGIDDGFISDNLQVLWAADNEVLIGFENVGIGSFEFEPPLCIGSEPADPPVQMTYKGTLDGLPSENVQAILIDRADSLWVGTNVGLVRWAADILLFRQIPLPTEAGLTINALAADALNTVWVGTQRGLVRLPAVGEAEFFNSENSPLVGNEVREIAVDDRAGTVWIATGSGLSRLDAGITPAETIDDVRAFPNPFNVISGEDRRVRFDAPFGSRIYIYSAAGQFVTEVDVSEGWNGRNDSGDLVASGVYLFVVRGPDGDYGRGKIALIHRR